MDTDKKNNENDEVEAYIGNRPAFVPLYEQGFSRQQAEDIYYWAVSDDFKKKCDADTTSQYDIHEMSDIEQVRLFLIKYPQKPQRKPRQLKPSQLPSTPTSFTNIIVFLAFCCTFLITLWFFLFL